MEYANLTNFMCSSPSWEIAKDSFIKDYKLRIVEPPACDYAIVRYVKDSSKFEENPIVGETRSVIIHKPTNKIVSVAPVKSTPYGEWNHSQTVAAQEFIDGTMINIYRRVDGSVDSASRSRTGSAKTKFSSKTFQEMIDDALSITPIKHYRDLLPEGWSCVSVVIQHAENRIVCPITLPRVYIISMTRIAEDGSITVSRDSAEWPETHRLYAPPSYDVGAVGNTPEMVGTFVNMKALAHKHAWQGVVLYGADGSRTKLRGIFYDTVKQLRGNDGCMAERYARVRSARQVKKYIEYFSEDETEFFHCEGELRAHTKELYDAYVDTNITKIKVYAELSWPYKYHVGRIHHHFIQNMRSLKKKVNFEYVVVYVNGLSADDITNIITGPAHV